MSFNKKALVNISSIFGLKDHHETFWVLYWELLLMDVSKTACGIVLVLLWFWIIGKAIKTPNFPNMLKCSISQVSMCHSEAYSESCQASTMDLSAKIDSNFYLLTIFAERFIIDIWEGCEYAYVIYYTNSIFEYWTKWKGNTYQ